MWCAMGQCYEHEQLGLNDAAIRCYRRALANGEREGIALHKLVRAAGRLGTRFPHPRSCASAEQETPAGTAAGQSCVVISSAPQLHVHSCAGKTAALEVPHRPPARRRTCTRGAGSGSRRRTTTSSTWRPSTP